MYYINKIVGFLLNPLGVVMILSVAAAIFARFHRKRLAWVSAILAFATLWFFSTGLALNLIGHPLEFCESVDVQDLPPAQAVVILGGGMGVNKFTGKAEMFGAADRVWHGARVFKAGKASQVIVTGGNVQTSTVPLLVEMGVPESAIVMYDDPRNTEEEARRIGAELGKGAKVILVTSAWHMNRALLVFRRAGVDAVPSATDYEMSGWYGEGLAFTDLLPNADAIARNSYAIKEWVAYLGYRWLRR